MTLWMAFLLMTAAAVFAVLWPLSRRRDAVQADPSDVVVYRDQLEEIARDRAAGRIAETEAEAARVEVSRRLIAAADASEPISSKPVGPAGLWRRRIAAVAVLVALPVGCGALYLAFGSPQLPAQPLAARMEPQPAGQQPVAELVTRVEGHLERNPDDGQGWEVVAPVYLRLGRYADAVRARQNALRLLGASAAREADLGEALVAAGNGVITADAKAAFDRALARDAKDVKARYFIGLAAEQDGRRDDAAKIWSALAADAPSDAPWLGFVRQALARVGGTVPAPAESPNTNMAAPAAPGPSAADVAAAKDMSETDRNEMIRGMVARLADRLRTEPADLEGWLRLLRAYMVLGQREKAMEAADDARRAFAAEPDKLRRIDELVKGLGLAG
ncbi:MAG: cytochrome c-type biosis protein CcmI [Xanthobacteraceae bacterium]|jgi:cytochrome c-type biogenesis protein CcmH|nr:cytochrome c-type biosis protein CcmI [Xanthobacteraceae bacterium]